MISTCMVFSQLFVAWLMWAYNKPLIRKFKRPIGGYAGAYLIPYKRGTFVMSQKAAYAALSNNITDLVAEHQEREIRHLVNNVSYATISAAYEAEIKKANLFQAKIYWEAMKRLDQCIKP